MKKQLCSPAKRVTSGLLSARARSSVHSSRSDATSAAASSLCGSPLPAAAACFQRNLHVTAHALRCLCDAANHGHAMSLLSGDASWCQ